MWVGLMASFQYFAGTSTMGAKLLSETRVVERGDKKLNTFLQIFYAILNGIVVMAILCEALGPAVELKFGREDIFSKVRAAMFLCALASYLVNIITSAILSIKDRKIAERNAQADQKELEASMAKYRPAKVADAGSVNTAENDENTLQTTFQNMKYVPLPWSLRIEWHIILRTIFQPIRLGPFF